MNVHRPAEAAAGGGSSGGRQPTPTPTTPVARLGSRGQIRPDDHDGVGRGAVPYPNSMELLDMLPVRAGECRFEVRFPGWTIDVAAASLEDAAWAAQEAVREHTPSETVEMRCAEHRGCDHPSEWIQIWQLM